MDSIIRIVTIFNVSFFLSTNEHDPTGPKALLCLHGAFPLIVVVP